MSSNDIPSVAYDPVTKPEHYNLHPSGVEIREITGEMGCPHLSNAVKYICRFEHKGNPAQDLRKAAKYLLFEIQRRLDPTIEFDSPFRPGPPIYQRRFAPFYRYIEAEPSHLVKRLLINVWNADKIGTEDALDTLRTARDRILGMADGEDRRAARQAEKKSPVPVESIFVDTDPKLTLGGFLPWSRSPSARGLEHFDNPVPAPEPEKVQVKLRAGRASRAVSQGDLLHGKKPGFTGKEITDSTVRVGREVRFQTKHGEYTYDANAFVYVTIPKERTS